MSHSTPLRTWIKQLNDGEFNAPDVQTQIKAGWHDWFCKDTSLPAKTQKLAKRVLQLASSPKVDLDTMYVFFKNNCAFHGGLYDDFRICDVTTGDVIYCVVPASGHAHKKGQAEVWVAAEITDDNHGPKVEGAWRDVLAYFEVPLHPLHQQRALEAKMNPQPTLLP